MKRIIYLVLILASFQSFISCKKNMDQVTVEYALSDFDTLVLNSVFTVNLIQGSENKIKIEGAKKIVDKISSEVKSNTLTILNNYKGNWMHPKNNKITVYLTVKQLKRIVVNETCNIQSINALTGDEIGLVMTGKLNEATLSLDCNTFYYWNNFPCGGRVNLNGNVNSLKIWNVALMAVDASELTANYTEVDNASKGDCKVKTNLSLIYKLSGEGNLYLRGNPAEIIKIEESSTGKLIIE